nr:DUF6078 family protein [Hoylesella marshii]
MTQEEYNLLDADFAHCSGKQSGRAKNAYATPPTRWLAENTRESYTVVNPAVITGRQPCSLFMPDRKERYAWGISRIYDNVRAADLRGIKLSVMSCLGSSSYYRIKQQRRTITEEEQLDIRQAFTDMGYDGQAMEFDRYEEHYPALMRLRKDD